ncbi:MAG: ATPase [Candidatus Eisenbacteria bacterium]|nr:ATPase [Candidatus Eisenbacteria bacterium]
MRLAVREAITRWLSRLMYGVAAVALASLVLEYGFDLSRGQTRLLHMIDLAVVALFVANAIVRFLLSTRKLAYVRRHWPSFAVLALILVQLGLVFHFQARGWLPAFLEARTVFSLTKAYIIVIQFYIVALIIGQAVKANSGLAARRIAPPRTVVLSFLLLIFVGTLFLLTPNATVPGEIDVVDAAFTATTSVCVTGLVVLDTGSYFTGFGQGVILVLIQIGGLGLITLTAFFALVVRRSLGVREGLVLRGMLSFESLGKVGRTLRYMIGITLVLEGAGAVLLFLTTRPDFGRVGEAAGRSVFHAVSAFCNAGLSLYSTSFERYVDNVPYNLVITTLIIAGGLGFPVIMNVLGRRVLSSGTSRMRSRWSLHSKIVLATTATLLLAGTLGFFLLESNGILAGKPLGEKLLSSYFASVTARTAGFNTVRTSYLAVPTLFMLAVLMFIGGSPGGTAGGVKTSTFGIVLASITSTFRGKGRVELFQRMVPDEGVREALVVVAMGIVVVAVGTFVLLIVEELPLKDVLFEVVSAFGTVGLSTGVTASLSPVGKIALMVIMLTGRIGPLTLALAIGEREEKPVYDYPRERVVIG